MTLSFIWSCFGLAYIFMAFTGSNPLFDEGAAVFCFGVASVLYYLDKPRRTR